MGVLVIISLLAFLKCPLPTIPMLAANNALIVPLLLMEMDPMFLVRGNNKDVLFADTGGNPLESSFASFGIHHPLNPRIFATEGASLSKLKTWNTKQQILVRESQER